MPNCRRLKAFQEDYIIRFNGIRKCLNEIGIYIKKKCPNVETINLELVENPDDPGDGETVEEKKNLEIDNDPEPKVTTEEIPVTTLTLTMVNAGAITSGLQSTTATENPPSSSWNDLMDQGTTPWNQAW